MITPRVSKSKSSERRRPRERNLHSRHSKFDATSTQSQATVNFNEKFISATPEISSKCDNSQPCPCANFLPQNDQDLWDMQFCRWWGYRWLRKKEDIIRQQLMKEMKK